MTIIEWWQNLATKEDVQEITSLVETVKSQLQFSLQAKLSLRKKSISRWSTTLRSIQPGFQPL